MERAIQCLLLLLVVAIAWVPGSASAAGLTGRYIGEAEPFLTLTLQEGADGVVTGTLSDGGMSMPINGRRKETALSGTVGPAEEEAIPGNPGWASADSPTARRAPYSFPMEASSAPETDWRRAGLHNPLTAGDSTSARAGSRHNLG